MFCTNCGSEIQEDWKICPNCGKPTGDFEEREINQQEGSYQSAEINVSAKKKRKWLLILAGIAAVLIILIVIVMLDNDTGRNPEAESLVQNGTYGDYTDVSIQEVLEYNWKDGEWDSFEGEIDSGKEAFIVEYAEDEARDTMAQFSVDMENKSFELVHLKLDGKAVVEPEANQEIEKMYCAYFMEKFPLDNIDLADYVGKYISELLEASEAFSKTDEDFNLYEDVSRQTTIMLDEEDTIDVVTLKGDGTYTPKFAGNKIGDELSELNISELEERGYTIIDSDGEYYAIYGNPENQSMISFESERDGIITSISWYNEMAEDMNDEYIFPDSDSRYLSENEVRSVEADKLVYARNEVFARHGRIFNDADIATYFEGLSWYEGTIPAEQFDADTIFNDFEKKNVELIKRIEDENTRKINTENIPQDANNEEYQQSLTTLRSGRYTAYDSPIIVTVTEPFYKENTLCVQVYWGIEGDEYRHNGIGVINEDWKEVWTGWGNFAYDGEKGTIDGEGVESLVYYSYDDELNLLPIASIYYLSE